MIVEKTSAGSRQYYRWEYALEGESRFRVLSPVLSEESAHERLCPIPGKVARAIKLYTLSLAHMANCLPANATGQPMTSIVRVHSTSRSLPPGADPLDGLPPESRELYERTGRAHDLPLVELVISYDGGMPKQKPISLSLQLYFTVDWENATNPLDIMRDISKISSPDYTGLLLSLSEDTYLGRVQTQPTVRSSTTV